MTDRLQRTLRGRNAILNIFELWVGLAGIITGVVFLYSPASIDNNALSKTIGYLLSAGWNLSYLLAGLLIWLGLLRPSPRWEVVGLYLLGSATAINGVAITSYFGLRGVATASTLFALGIASWLRASFVLKTALRLSGERNAIS
jgi:hypothetical protein